MNYSGHTGLQKHSLISSWWNGSVTFPQQKITLMLTMVQKKERQQKEEQKMSWSCVTKGLHAHQSVNAKESTGIGRCAFWFSLIQFEWAQAASFIYNWTSFCSTWTFCHQLKPWYLPKWIQSKCRWPGNAICLTVGPFSQVLRHKVKIKSQSVWWSRWMTGPVYSSV